MSVHQSAVLRNRVPRPTRERSRGILPNVASLRSARKSLGLTQEQLAALAGVDVKTVRNGESGSRLDVASLTTIAAALDLELSEVLADSGAVRKSRYSVVKRLQLAWLRRDAEQLLLAYHADAVLVLPGEPLIPFSGRHQGHTEIARVCERAWCSLTELPCRDSKQLVLDSPTAFAFRCCGRFRTNTHQLFRLSCTHIFEFEERQIIHHHIEYDTLALSRIMFQS